MSRIIASALSLAVVSASDANDFMMNRIKALREQRGWSTRELAELANTTSSNISKLENGRTQLNVQWIERMSRAFQVPPNEIVDLEASMQEFGPKSDVEPLASKPGVSPNAEDENKYRVLTPVLDQIGIIPGAIVTLETNPRQIAKVASGEIVIALQRVAKQDLLILRQFIWPSILIANSSSMEPPVINIRLQEVGIRGVVTESVNKFGAKDQASSNRK